MNKLTRLANKWQTDKGTVTGDAHGYTEIYQSYFKKYNRPKIIEIGVLRGGSIHMLNDFYNGDCEIWACDWDNDTKYYVDDLPNIHFVNIDAGDKDSIERFRNSIKDVGIDIIIDDSSHVWQHQMNLLSGLHGVLNEKGIYIIEDIHFSRLFEKSEESPLFFINFLKPSCLLSDEENSKLLSTIKDVQIFSRKNLSTSGMVERFGGRSMTAVITFEQM